MGSSSPTTGTGDMFGFLALDRSGGPSRRIQDLISTILDDLGLFRGDDGEQEDDVTMVTIKRTSSAVESAVAFGDDLEEIVPLHPRQHPGQRAGAMVRVAKVAAELGLEGERLERLKTAVSEAAMNAIEHGNKGDPDLPVVISVSGRQRENPGPDPQTRAAVAPSGRSYPQPRSQTGGRAEPAGLGPLPHREDGRRR